MATKPIPLVQFLSSHTAYQARLLAMQLRCSLPLVQDIYRIVGNFWGRKLSRILRFCGYSRKFSPWNLGVWCPLAPHKRAIHESFLCENCIFHQFAKVFSLESFLLYGMPDCGLVVVWLSELSGRTLAASDGYLGRVPSSLGTWPSHTEVNSRGGWKLVISER